MTNNFLFFNLTIYFKKSYCHFQVQNLKSSLKTVVKLQIKISHQYTTVQTTNATKNKKRNVYKIKKLIKNINISKTANDFRAVYY